MRWPPRYLRGLSWCTRGDANFKRPPGPMDLTFTRSLLLQPARGKQVPIVKGRQWLVVRECQLGFRRNGGERGYETIVQRGHGGRANGLRIQTGGEETRTQAISFSGLSPCARGSRPAASLMGF